VPSAEEIASHGQNLGQVNAILLEKVEELSLHLIEKDKQITGQQEKLNNQESRIKHLEELMGKLFKDRP